jgi:hypothetical protein
MFPTKTARKWPLYLAGAAFVLFAIKDPEGAANAVQTVAIAFGRFVDAF